MTEQLDLGNCYYRPSFFNMKVDVFIELNDLTTVPEGTMGLYFHEYIHYLQDISTIYGLMNMSTINYYIQACAHYISQQKETKEFKVPLRLEEIKIQGNAPDYGISNFSLRQIYMGSSIKSKSRAIDKFQYEIKSFEYNHGKFIDKVYITFYDIDIAEDRELEFGGVHVSEGMAYLCEQYHYEKVLNTAPDYPYLIVQKLARVICPEIIEFPVLLIALCDISLMTYHPGLSFVRLLNFVKNEYAGKGAYNLEKFYDACSQHVKGSHPNFGDLAEYVRKQISKNFNADYYGNIQEWINLIFERITTIRSEIPTFMLDILHEEPRRNKYFAAILNQVGSPLVLDGYYNGTISLPHGYKPTGENFNPGIFMAIGQVLKIFHQDQPSPCELKEYCLKSKESDLYLNVDENCDAAPWKKAQEKNLCPVGQIWHHWALKEFSPKYEIEEE